MKRLIYAGIIVSGLYYAGQTLAFGLLCGRRSGESWMDPKVKTRCHQAIIIKWTQGIFGIVSDVYIFILPLPLIWALKLSLRRRLGVLAVFATGFLCVVTFSFCKRSSREVAQYWRAYWGCISVSLRLRVRT